MILYLINNVGILQNRYNMAFLKGLVGIVDVDIFLRNSSIFSYSFYMVHVGGYENLYFDVHCTAAFQELLSMKKNNNNMPLYFTFIIFKQRWRNNYTTDVVTRKTF